jgi:hypothetical protein
MRRLAFFLLAFTALSANAESRRDPWELVGVDRVPRSELTIGDYEDVTVRFANGRSYKVPLYRTEPITVLRGEDGVAYLLTVGADCVMCDEHNTLRFFLLGGKELVGSGKRHSYPGTLKDYESSELVSKTRTFYGRCLSDKSDVVVWFTEYLGDDDKWHRASTVARVSKGGEVETEGASLVAVTDRAKAGACKELPGTEGTTEP